MCRPRGEGYMEFERRYQGDGGRRFGYEGRGGAGMRGVYSLGGGGVEMEELGGKREGTREGGMNGFGNGGANGTGTTRRGLSGPLNSTPR